jgi:hypothetical protein
MRQRSKGFSTRYDKDLGGNHIEALRKQAPQLGVFLDFAHRWCSCCGKKKPTKGGTKPGKGWACADCKPKGTATPNAPHERAAEGRPLDAVVGRQSAATE